MSVKVSIVLGLASFSFCRVRRVAGRFFDVALEARASSWVRASVGAVIGVESSFGELDGFEEEKRR